MEQRLHPGLQTPLDHRLSDSVGYLRYAERPHASVALRYFHPSDCPGKIAPRGHPIPDLVQVVVQVFLEVFYGLLVDARCTMIRLHLLVRRQDLEGPFDEGKILDRRVLQMRRYQPDSESAWVRYA